MQFSIFYKVDDKKHRGVECTKSVLEKAIRSKAVKENAPKIASGDKELKKELPAVTWQSYFPDGERKSEKAVPSGLYMLDIDHIENPTALWLKVEPRVEELGVVVAHMTPSTKGLRLVAIAREEFSTIAENQQWLASQIGVQFDAVCKDWARASFLVPEDYFYYLSDRLWAACSPLSNLKVGAENHKDMKGCKDFKVGAGTQVEYNGIPLTKIVAAWLDRNGGIPQPGDRNNRFYKLALQLRYICDFDPYTVASVIPDCGLPKGEVMQICKSACSALRGSKIPSDLQLVIARLEREQSLLNDLPDEEPDEELDEMCVNKEVPPLPPCFKQWYEAAPDDFKEASILVQLPILGTLGSKLRAPYLDGNMHSPSFQVTLEAPQASGKSFMRKIADYELRDLKEHDQKQREAERAWMEDFKNQKATNSKMTSKERDALIAKKPQSLIRYLPATASLTKMLDRTNQAKGLHLFAMSEEIDTVYKAFKRGFSNLSDVLRCAFDNAEYGQDYATENSFSGIVRLYYNTLYSGTPKALRRFYPDVEDGLVSRVVFVSIPDQFGKPMPVWREFTAHEQRDMDLALCRLSAVSIQGDEVQEEYRMQMPWLNRHLKKWILAQQRFAVKTNDRTRDQFCRRAAVVGFRVGMLAWYLWNEKENPLTKRNVCRFAQWTANAMLDQHIVRFNIMADERNTTPYRELYKALPDTFTHNELKARIEDMQVGSTHSLITHRWKSAHLIQYDEKAKLFYKVACSPQSN